MTTELDQSLPDPVKHLARDNRMDLVGVAPIYRFANAPKPVRPESHLPSARAVVAMCIRYPYALFDRAGRGAADTMAALEVYQNTVIGHLLYKAATRLCRFLEDRGHEAIPMCVSGRWSVHPHKGIETNWMADFSNRHAAVAAGLGELGLHSLCITPEFGTRQRFISLITSAPLVPDPMYDGPPLCDNCMKCARSCPMKCMDADKLEHCDFVDKQYTYATVDHWRCAWSEQADMNPDEGPKHFGNTVKIMPPEEGPIDDEMFLQSFYRKCNEEGLQAKFTHAMGRCMRVCEPPHLRDRDRFDPATLEAAPY